MNDTPDYVAPGGAEGNAALYWGDRPMNGPAFFKPAAANNNNDRRRTE
ncbi:MAG: hypothetical protein WD672_00510 [Woeseia sp.]